MAFNSFDANRPRAGAYTKGAYFGAHKAIYMNRLQKNQKSQKRSAASQHPLTQTTSRYFSRLMRPSEVDEATKDYPDPVRKLVAGHWTLCGDVSATMFNLLKEPQTDYLPTRLTGFRSSDGVSYGVVTHQVQGHQHRSVLCLYDPSVREFLEATTKDRLFFMLGNDDSEEAVLLGSPLKPVEFVPLLAMSLEATEEQQRQAVFELPAVVEIMSNPRQVPNIPGCPPVKHVSVTLLLPTILGETLRTAMRNATRK